MSTHARFFLLMRNTCIALAALTLATVAAVRAQDPINGPINDPLTLLNRPRDAGPDAPAVPAHPQKYRDVEEAIGRGLEFLESWQSPNGSWDRLENYKPPVNSSPLKTVIGEPDVLYHNPPFDGPVKDLAENSIEEVADTCLSGQAMLDAITSGRRPELSQQCIKSIDFVCKQIDKWNGDTIYIQSRVFDPIHDSNPSVGKEHFSDEPAFYNPTVDTFFALEFLANARDKIDRSGVQKKIDRAVAILLQKIDRKQRRHGDWPDDTDPVIGLENNSAQYFFTLCVALRAVEQAARQGLPVKPETRYRAEDLFRGLLDAVPFQAHPKVHYTVDNLQPYNDALPLKLTISLATLYDVDLTARQLLAKARQTPGVSAGQIGILEKHAAEARTELKVAVTSFTHRYRDFAVCGPALPCLPDFINAVAEFAPDDAQEIKMLVLTTLLSRQRNDGHLVTGLWNIPQGAPGRGDQHPDRGDNTFGTASSLMTLMEIEDTKIPAPSK